MKVVIFDTYEGMSKYAAKMIADRMKAKPDMVLGLATGSTPVGTYQELIKLHKEQGLDFSKARSFNLDEYLGLAGDHDQSYRYFMNTNLFDGINIDKANTRVPDGTAADPAAFCAEYEKAIKDAGGIDFQVLGIGGNGHIAFNEPGSPKDSRTRVVDLDEGTIKDNARFFESVDDVPTKALSMGMATIMEAKEVILLANKANKADAIQKSIEGPVTEQVPASILQEHPNVTFLVEKEAAAKLTGDYEKVQM
jgi:glucosamine-6-phosphate deaminase